LSLGLSCPCSFEGDDGDEGLVPVVSVSDPVVSQVGGLGYLHRGRGLRHQVSELPHGL